LFETSVVIELVTGDLVLCLDPIQCFLSGDVFQPLLRIRGLCRRDAGYAEHAEGGEQ
jgi:hypothetical protein